MQKKHPFFRGVQKKMKKKIGFPARIENFWKKLGISKTIENIWKQLGTLKIFFR
jgi:ribosomal protein L31